MSKKIINLIWFLKLELFFLYFSLSFFHSATLPTPSSQIIPISSFTKHKISVLFMKNKRLSLTNSMAPGTLPFTYVQHIALLLLVIFKSKGIGYDLVLGCCRMIIDKLSFFFYEMRHFLDFGFSWEKFGYVNVYFVVHYEELYM